jgi:hypothetical protein
LPCRVSRVTLRRHADGCKAFSGAIAFRSICRADQAAGLRRYTRETLHHIAVIVFSLVAVLQLVRVALGWEITVNGAQIPLWASGIAGLVAAVLAFSRVARSAQNDRRISQEASQ